MKLCHDCGAKPGEMHKRGCDTESCPFCGGQLLSCNCVYEMLGDEFGWKYKPMIVRMVNPRTGVLLDATGIPSDYTEHVPMGSDQMLITHPTNGLPRKVYMEGPTEAQQERWEEKLKKQGRMLWTGEWPGAAECRKFNLWSKMVPGQGWVKCDKDDPEATESLNELYEVCKWDRKAKEFVLR